MQSVTTLSFPSRLLTTGSVLGRCAGLFDSRCVMQRAERTRRGGARTLWRKFTLAWCVRDASRITPCLHTPASPPQGSGSIAVNGRSLADYFPLLLDRHHALEPLLASQTAGAFDILVTARGGGVSGQSGAIRHGLAKALARFDPLLKPSLATGEHEAGVYGCVPCITLLRCISPLAHISTVQRAS